MKKNFILTILSILLIQCAAMADVVKFAQVADSHFISGDKYRTEVLKSTVESINKEKGLAFVVFTGYNLDSQNEQYLPEFLQIINKLNIPYYLVIGNHDVFKNNGLSKKHYLEVVKENNCFINIKSQTTYSKKMDLFLSL